MTLKMLQANPGVYAAGVSGAPVTKWELYDTHYTERYMGSPVADAKAYAASDALQDAARIADPLLLIHGMGTTMSCSKTRPPLPLKCRKRIARSR